MTFDEDRRHRLWNSGHDSTELEIMSEPAVRRAKLRAAVILAEQCVTAEIQANRLAEEQRQWLHYIHIVGQSFNSPNKRSVIKAVQRAVCKHYGVSHADLISSRRTAHVIRARQVAMYLAKILTAKSLLELGRQFGDKDHTTVLHGVNRITRRLSTDAVLAAEVATIRRTVEGP